MTGNNLGNKNHFSRGSKNSWEQRNQSKMTGNKTKEQNLLLCQFGRAQKREQNHKSSKRQQDHGFEIKIHTQTKKEWKKKRRNEEQSYKTSRS